MTIKAQIDALFRHPALPAAMDSYQQGDEIALRHIFFETIFHVYQKTTLNASRTYGTNRWLDSCEILQEIRDTPPPDNLDLRLPIPEKKVIVEVVPVIKIKVKKPTAVKHFSPIQLSLLG